jgi:tetratricopeptide (TPR) repeat protein
MARSSTARARTHAVPNDAAPPQEPVRQRSQRSAFEVVGPDWVQNQPNQTVAKLAMDAAELIDGGDAAAGLKLCEQAIRLCSDDAVLHCLHACALVLTDHFSAAIKACRRAIRLNRKFPETYIYLGCALVGVGRSSKVILEAFNQAAELGTSHPAVHYWRGICLGALSRPAEAIEAYSTSLRIAEETDDIDLIKRTGQAIDSLCREFTEKVGKSKKPGYTGGKMDTAAANAAAARTLLGNGVKDLPNSDLKELLRVVAAEIETRRKAQGAMGEPRIEHAAKETTGRRSKEPPRPDWIEAHKRGVTVPDFIERAFAAEIADRTMHKGLFSRYENLRRDFYSYQRSNELPDWLKAIPTQDEWDKRQIAEGKATPVEAPAPPAQPDELRSYWRGQKRVASARRRGIPVVGHP